MTPKQQRDDYPPTEAMRRRDAALRVALSMPAIPHTESIRKGKKKAGASPKRRRRPKA